MNLKVYLDNTQSALRAVVGRRKRASLGPMAYLDIYENMDKRRPQVGDEYVVTKVSDFVDPVHGVCWPCEARRKL